MTEPDIMVVDLEDFKVEPPLPSLVASVAERYSMEVFACHDASCAPPPVGTGGSRPKGGGAKGSGGSGGGGHHGPSADDTKITATPESKRLAAGIYSKAKELEPEITANLAKLVGDADPANYKSPPPAQLYGFEHRLKTEAKIAEKIERIVAEKGIDRDRAAQDVKDAVRFTIHYPDDTFGNHAQAVVDSLRSSNANVRVKNTWPPESGVPYKGINVQVTRHDGVRYEVQFHTPNSQRVKDQMHKLYEEQRVLHRDNPRWQEIELEMERMADRIPIPTGAMEVFALFEGNDEAVFFKSVIDDEVTALARLVGFDTWVNTGDGWRELPILLSLAEDTGWELIEDQGELDQLLADFGDEDLTD
jgi:hypothetical protein